MNRQTEQDSRWFVTDIVRHAKMVMEKHRTDTARLFVTHLSTSEVEMLQAKFESVTRDITGHITLKIPIWRHYNEKMVSAQ